MYTVFPEMTLLEFNQLPKEKKIEGSESTIISSVSRNFPCAAFLEVRKYQLLCDMISLLPA